MKHCDQEGRIRDLFFFAYQTQSTKIQVHKVVNVTDLQCPPDASPNDEKKMTSTGIKKRTRTHSELESTGQSPEQAVPKCDKKVRTNEDLFDEVQEKITCPKKQKDKKKKREDDNEDQYERIFDEPDDFKDDIAKIVKEQNKLLNGFYTFINDKFSNTEDAVLNIRGEIAQLTNTLNGFIRSQMENNKAKPSISILIYSIN